MATLSFATDGTMWTINAKSQARRYLGMGAWVVDDASLLLKAISAGTQVQIRAIDADGNLYSFVNSAVKLITYDSNPMYLISCSQVDDTMWGVDYQRNAWVYNSRSYRWDAPPAGTPQMEQISVASATNVVCIEPDKTVQQWDGSSWHKVDFGGGNPNSTIDVSALSDGTIFTIEPSENPRSEFPKIYQYTPNDAGGVDRTALPGEMNKISAALTGTRSYALWGSTANVDGKTGTYTYDFKAGQWNLLGKDYYVAAPFAGGGFVVSGSGSGMETVLRSEIADQWTSIQMPYRANTVILCPRSQNQFIALTSDGKCYRWAGLAWVKQSFVPDAKLTALSVANDRTIFVVDANGLVQELLDASGWKQHPGGVFTDVSGCSFQTGYAIDGNNQIQALAVNPNTGRAVWSPVALPPGLPAGSWTGAFAASMDGTLTIATNRGDLWLYDPQTKEWDRTHSPGFNFVELSAQDENHIFAINADGQYWTVSEDAPPVTQEQVWDIGETGGDLYELLMDGAP